MNDKMSYSQELAVVLKQSERPYQSVTGHVFCVEKSNKCTAFQGLQRYFSIGIILIINVPITFFIHFYNLNFKWNLAKVKNNYFHRNNHELFAS